MVVRSIQTARTVKNWVCLFLSLQCALTCGIAQAGSYGINPVKLTLSAQNSTQIITVRNDGAQAAVMQVELAAWSQADGQDVYTPTRELLATPPIFTVPAGVSQIIRVGLRRAPDEQRELVYRLFLQEVPPPAKDRHGEFTSGLTHQRAGIRPASSSCQTGFALANHTS